MVDTPGIELIASEAAQAGASRLAVVTSPRKQGIMEFFDRDELLEDTLESRGKTEQLNKVRAVNEMITAVSVNQDRPLGLGDADLVGRGGTRRRRGQLRRAAAG